MPRVKRTESGGFLLPLADAEIDWLRFDTSGAELSLNSDFAKLRIGPSSFASLRSQWPGFDPHGRNYRTAYSETVDGSQSPKGGPCHLRAMILRRQRRQQIRDSGTP